MKLLLLGDISPTAVTAPLFQKKDIDTLFTDTVSIFQGNDFTFVNLECALTESPNEIKKYGPPIKAPAETAEVLKTLGVDCCGISNNHVFDYGVKGMEDTFKALDNVGLPYTGFGKNYKESRKNFVVEKHGETVCIIAVCEHEYSYALDDRMGCRPYDEYDTIEDIREAKNNCDKVIVIYHGGKEFCQYPSPRLHKLCHAMARGGADMILCQHSHCIGTYERYNDCHIVYGQGNFHFVKPPFVTSNTCSMWDVGLAVTYDTISGEAEFIVVCAEGNGIKLAKGKEKEVMLIAFKQRSQTLASGEWKEGWHSFCEEVKETYLDAIGNACTEHSSEYDNGLFGHFLDCEAHTDVWRELFPSLNLSNEK